MPYLHLTTSAPLPENGRDRLVRRLAEAVAVCTDKDIEYVMVFVSPAVGGLGGGGAPAAFADVRGIGGLYDAVNARLSAAISDVLHDELGLPADAVYLNFTSVRAYNWGWNGRTFD